MIKTQVPDECQAGSACLSVVPGYQPTRDFEKPSSRKSLKDSVIANETAERRREAGEAAALKSHAKVRKKARVLVR